MAQQSWFAQKAENYTLPDGLLEAFQVGRNGHETMDFNECDWPKCKPEGVLVLGKPMSWSRWYLFFTNDEVCMVAQVKEPVPYDAQPAIGCGGAFYPF